MKSSIKLGRIFGIEIGAHISWIIIVALVTLSLASYFATTQTGWSPTMRWNAALLTALLFFASVLAHEVGHSLVAKRYGIPVRSIMLFLFGGVSQIEREAKRPSEELWIAIFGPMASIAIAALSYVVSIAAGKGTFIGAVASWLAGVNVALALFNMLPGLPLDGGRVLRGLVWLKTGDMRQATNIAAGAGQALAMLMILGGVLVFFRPGGGFSGLWLAFIGWFLLDAARVGAHQIEIEQALRGITAADLMTRDCSRIMADLPLSQFVDEHLLRTGQRCFLVTENEDVLGIITARDLHAIERARWSQMVVADAMRSFDQMLWVAPDTSADRVLEIMGREEINQLPVVADGRLQGIVSREHIIRLLTTHKEFATSMGEPVTNQSMQSKQRESSRQGGSAASREATGLH